MIKNILVGLMLLLPTTAFSQSVVKREMLDPVIKIDEQCSAVGIMHNKEFKYLTAAHCVAGGDGYIVDEGTVLKRGDNIFKKTRYTSWYYEVEKVDTMRDLALFKVVDPSYKGAAAKVADKLQVEEGDNVWAVGFPMAKTKNISQGLFNGLEYEDWGNGTYRPKYRATAEIFGGNSGGALFQQTKEGFELVGITSMAYKANTFMNLFVTLDDIQYFLKAPVVKPSDVTKRPI
jgi:S1-C subfamily serine protease